MRKRNIILLLCILLLSVESAKAELQEYSLNSMQGNNNSYSNSNTSSQTQQPQSYGGFAPAQRPAWQTQSMLPKTNTTNYSYNSQKPAVTKPQSNQPQKQIYTEPVKRVEYISSQNPSNSNIKYYYYIPASLRGQTTAYPVIIWVPGLDGDGQESIDEKLYNLADTKGFAILSPTFKFNEEDFKQSKSYQYPQAWSGDALIRMLNQAKNNGLNYSKLYMVGFSAGAQFSSRFSFMRPDMVAACALLSSGARVKPDKKTGVKYFIGIGSMDTEYRLENAEIFNKAANALNIPIIYKKYDMDHTTNEQEFNDVADFFDKVKTNKF